MKLSRRRLLSGVSTAVTSRILPPTRQAPRFPFEPRVPGKLNIKEPLGPYKPSPPLPQKRVFDPVSPSSPIHLTAVTTVTSNSSSGANAIALRNPTDRAMDILEIKFSLRTSTPSNVVPFGVFGGAVACKMDLGKIPISGGFVPVWCFGRADNLLRETRFDSGLIPGSVSFFETSWKLPRPFYIPAGATVSVAFQHRGLLQNDIEARVSYSGRTHAGGEPPPKAIFVPYVAAFSSKSFDASIAGSDASTEADLVNPFQESINLQRFVGRLMVVPNGAATLLETDHPVVGCEMVKVRMVDSHGRPIIHDYTTFRQAFGAETRSWEMDNGTVLEPGGYYIAYIKHDTAVEGTIAGPALMTQAQIAFNGWREVYGEGM